MSYTYSCATGAVATAVDTGGGQYPICTDGSGAWVETTSFAETRIDAASFSALMVAIFVSWSTAYAINKLMRTFFGGKRL